MTLVRNLRDRLPGKVGLVLTSMDEVESVWEEQDKGQFPFSGLCDEIEALKNTIRGEYGGELET